MWRYATLAAEVVRLGRSAVDISVQGVKPGEALFVHAFERCASIADELGVFAVEVYARNEKARAFYLKFGLTELADDPAHLYISIKEIKNILA